MSQPAYILGHSAAEIRRLTFQALVLRPITERLLRQAGLAPGMRVLDIGCGAGDVAMIAADMVGRDGQVVGIDRSPEAVAAARGRIRDAGYDTVQVREATVNSFEDPTPFDLVVGRYVLVHQADPATFLRAAARHVRPGGVIACHEIMIAGQSQDPNPLWRETLTLIYQAFQSVLPHPDAAARLVEHFDDAGLGLPEIFCEIPVGCGPNSLLYAWLALSLRNVLPQLERNGANTAKLDIETLEDRLRATVTSVRGQALGPLQFCAWTKRP